ncbi:MAG: lactate racemase domain-containing protein [Acidimicrobiales bacterium]
MPRPDSCSTSIARRRRSYSTTGSSSGSKLPPGRSRVIYPAEPSPAIDDVEGAIRDALCTRSATASRCRRPCPGMKLTIAFDDIRCRCPRCAALDIRQRIIEQVLDMAAAAGVDDVHLIAALALHRRMTEAELRHAVGDRVYDAFAARPAVQPRRRGLPTTSPTWAPPTRARRSRSTSGPPRAT